MIRDLFKQLWKDKFARIALIVLGLIYFALLFADFIAPYTKDFRTEQWRMCRLLRFLQLMKTANFQSLIYTITKENLIKMNLKLCILLTEAKSIM